MSVALELLKMAVDKVPQVNSTNPAAVTGAADAIAVIFKKLTQLHDEYTK